MTAAGIPCSCIVLSAESPGDRMVTLIGSTITWFSASLCKPCQASPGFTHSACVSLGVSSAIVGSHTSNHQLCSHLPAHRVHRPAEADGLVNRLLHQRAAGRLPIIVTRDTYDAMMPYCGEVEVCIMKVSVEARDVELLVFGVLDVDHRRLREGGEKLVRRMRGEGDGVLRARRLRRRDAVETVVELVEVGTGIPGLAEVQHLD